MRRGLSLAPFRMVATSSSPITVSGVEYLTTLLTSITSLKLSANVALTCASCLRIPDENGTAVNGYKPTMRFKKL